MWSVGGPQTLISEIIMSPVDFHTISQIYLFAYLLITLYNSWTPNVVCKCQSVECHKGLWSY